MYIFKLWFSVLVLSISAYAQYPDKNIKVIIHVSPGGGTDSMARLVLQNVGKKLGTSFIIENYKGAGGQIGYTALAMAKPDGYTIGTITTTSIITHELMRKNVAYRLEESFIPIARIVHDPSGIFVRSDSPIETIEDLFEEAKKRPGKISLGGTSLWGAHHIQSILLKQICGIELNYIPFDGDSEVRNNLLGGHIEASMGGSSEYKSLIESGKVRALVVASSSRLAYLPNIPTYKDYNYDLTIGSDRGLAAPTGTHPHIIQLLSDTIKQTLDNPDFLVSADRMFLTPVLAYLDYSDFKEYLFGFKKKLYRLLSQYNKGNKSK